MDHSAYRDMAATEKAHWWFVARRKIISDVLERLGLPEGAKILEVGAGTGGNLSLLKSFGKVSAVEMDDFAREYATHSTGVPVKYGFLPDNLPAEAVGFDLICMFDVLEHVEFDKESLKVLSDRLSPGGKILITVPAYPFMWTDHDVVLHHFRRYTRNSLSAAIRGAGLVVDRVTYFNMVLFPLAAVVRIFNSIGGGKGSPGSKLPSKFVNAALSHIFKSEAPVLRHLDLPFGLSIMAVVSRQ